MQQFQQGRGFPLVRRTRQAAAEGVSEAIGISTAPVAERAQGEGPRALEKDRLVEGRQRLERRVGARPADAGEVAVGCIERLEHRVWDRTVAERVQSASVPIGTGRLMPDL